MYVFKDILVINCPLENLENSSVYNIYVINSYVITRLKYSIV